MGLSDWIHRRRHRRGYGVHSPEGFRLVKRVIRPGREAAYYGEETLDLRDEPHRLVKEAKLLLRAVAYAQPAFVWMSAGMPPILTEAVRLAGGVVRIFDGALYPDELPKADMTVVYKTKLTKKQLAAATSPGKTLIAFDIAEKFLDYAEEALASGILLEWKTGFLLEARSDSERYIYPV